jgi:hypothetical protein
MCELRGLKTKRCEVLQKTGLRKHQYAYGLRLLSRLNIRKEEGSHGYRMHAFIIAVSALYYFELEFET